MSTFTAKQLDLLTLSIMSYKNQIQDDILMYKDFNHQSKDIVKRLNELQTEYFDLEVLWKLCYKLEREVREAE
jgi:competence transcription factor ComK